MMAIFSNVLFVLVVPYYFFHLTYVCHRLRMNSELLQLALKFYKYNWMPKKRINEAMVTAHKKKDIRSHFSNTNDPASIRLQFTSFITNKDRTSS